MIHPKSGIGNPPIARSVCRPLPTVNVPGSPAGILGVTLDVDSDNVTSAIRLYLKAGMVARPAFSVWERALTM